MIVGSSPLSLAVSITYLLVIVSSLLFSAALIAASLVMRHAESLSYSKQSQTSSSRSH